MNANQKAFGYVLLVTLSLGVAVKAYRDPAPTFDRLLYAATVVHLQTSSPEEIARRAFELAGFSMDYPRTAFSNRLLAEPTLIVEQVPFYAIRPLYVRALSIVGLRLVSPLAYLGIVAVLLLWLRNPWWVLPIALLPDLIAIAREITPDALAECAILGGLLLVKRRYMLAGLLVLLGSLGIRTDNLFILLPLVFVLAHKRELDWKNATLCASVGVGIVVAINHYAHNYGWALLMRHSFGGGIVHPAGMHVSISAREYLGYLSHGITGAFVVCSLWVLLGALVWRWSNSSRPFLLVAGAFSFLHILAFPKADPRYFVPAFLLVAVLLVEAFGGHESGLNRAEAPQNTSGSSTNAALGLDAEA